MTQTLYQRVDLSRLEADQARRADDRHRAASAERVGWPIFPFSLAFCVAQALVTVLAENVSKVTVTSTLIPILAFAVLLAIVLAVNPFLRVDRNRALGLCAALVALNVPLLWLRSAGPFVWRLGSDVLLAAACGSIVLLLARLVRMRPFSRGELACLFSAMLVTAGISTFGLTSQLVPLLPAAHNPQWNSPQRGWEAITPRLRPELYIQDRAAIESFYGGIGYDSRGRRLKPPADGAGWDTRVRYGAEVFRAIPWAIWAAPLAYWLILVAGVYGLFYALSYIVLPYWRDREKLIFPLAQLPLSLLPSADPTETVPSPFRTMAFWTGFTLSAGLWAWNGLALNGAIGPSLRIPLGINRGVVDAALTGTVWEGLGRSTYSALTFLIIFTAIGIAFLLPLQSSFSIWFYFLVGKVVILIAVWMGYGRVGDDFPRNWLWFSNPVSAQGGGGMLLFSAITLVACLRGYAQSLRERGPGQRASGVLPVVGLAASLGVITWWLQWNYLGWFWAALVVLVTTMLTIGLMRIVAEGGVYWFQSHISFFHLYKMLGLGKFLAAPLLAPLILAYSVMFLDIKTFMAPNLLNAAAMRADTGASRTRFHVNVVACVSITVVFSLTLAIFLAHLRGAAGGMEPWFYVRGPTALLDTARDAASQSPSFDAVSTTWCGIGAAWVALSMYLRTSIFWFPHPIGYIMLINPLVAELWFSFFIGWACKWMAVRYGGRQTFERVKGVFIGLILGELMSIFFWLSLSLLYPGIRATGIDLNRSY